MRVKFVVEGDPVGKQRARIGRGSHFYTPQRTEDYADRVRDNLWRTLGPDGLRVFQTDPVVSVTVHCFFRNLRHPDADNCLKLVLDALQRIVYRNDRSVAGGTTIAFDPARPRIEVELV